RAAGVERRRARLVVVAEVRRFLVADVRCIVLVAASYKARRVVRAHAAHVQLGPALRAFVAPRQRKRQLGERFAAAPAVEPFGHVEPRIGASFGRTTAHPARPRRRAIAAILAPAAEMPGGSRAAKLHRTAPVRRAERALWHGIQKSR